MLLSIITPCLNRVSFVREAVESVLGQDYSPVEHIVVDGGSTDGTLDVLAQYEGLKVISEPDEGIYDALNKGLAIASGEILGFLNADDAYVPGVFGLVMKSFREGAGWGTVCGGAEIFGDSQNGNRKRIFLSPSYSSLSIRNVCLGQPILNARFFHKAVFKKVGGFDPRYKIASDREFLIRLALAGIPSQHVPKCVYRYRSHSGSLTFDPSMVHAFEVNEEYLGIAERYLEEPLNWTERFWIQLWHARISVEMLLGSWKNRDSKRMKAVVRRGYRGSFWWPVILCARVLRRLTVGLRGRPL